MTTPTQPKDELTVVTPTGGKASSSRLPYKAPRLRHLGSVRELYGVLAARGYGCKASDRTPLFDLCLYGANRDLRGYVTGRYRDRTMFAAQSEYRFPVAGRFGGVVFAGSGKVAGAFSEMGNEPWLPSYGVGVRWLAAETAKVNLSVDVAKGRDSTGVYVYVKESF